MKHTDITTTNPKDLLLAQLRAKIGVADIKRLCALWTEVEESKFEGATEVRTVILDMIEEAHPKGYLAWMSDDSVNDKPIIRFFN